MPPLPFLDNHFERAGGGKATLAGGCFRPSRTASTASASLPASSVGFLSCGNLLVRSRVGCRRSQNEAWDLLSASASLSPPPLLVKQDDAASTVNIWESLAPLARRDHMSNLLRRPLPSRDLGSHVHYTTKSSVGPIPVAPTHLKLVQSHSHGSHNYGPDKQEVCAAQQVSELWRGFPKDQHTDFNEARCRMGHIMRK